MRVGHIAMVRIGRRAQNDSRFADMLAIIAASVVPNDGSIAAAISFSANYEIALALGGLTRPRSLGGKSRDIHCD